MVLIRDGVVRRCGDDRRVRVPLEDAVGREGDTWGCVAGVGFQKQVAFREFRNLRADEVGESKPKQFLDITGTGKSFIRSTYERFRSEERR